MSAPKNGRAVISFISRNELSLDFTQVFWYDTNDSPKRDAEIKAIIWKIYT